MFFQTKLIKDPCFAAVINQIEQIRGLPEGIAEWSLDNTGYVYYFTKVSEIILTNRSTAIYSIHYKEIINPSEYLLNYIYDKIY